MCGIVEVVVWWGGGEGSFVLNYTWQILQAFRELIIGLLKLKRNVSISCLLFTLKILHLSYPQKNILFPSPMLM